MKKLLLLNLIQCNIFLVNLDIPISWPCKDKDKNKNGLLYFTEIKRKKVFTRFKISSIKDFEKLLEVQLFLQDLSDTSII